MCPPWPHLVTEEELESLEKEATSSIPPHTDYYRGSNFRLLLGYLGRTAAVHLFRAFAMENKIPRKTSANFQRTVKNGLVQPVLRWSYPGLECHGANLGSQ